MAPWSTLSTAGIFYHWKYLLSTCFVRCIRQCVAPSNGSAFLYIGLEYSVFFTWPLCSLLELRVNSVDFLGLSFSVIRQADHTIHQRLWCSLPRIHTTFCHEPSKFTPNPEDQTEPKLINWSTCVIFRVICSTGKNRRLGTQSYAAGYKSRSVFAQFHAHIFPAAGMACLGSIRWISSKVEWQSGTQLINFAPCFSCLTPSSSDSSPSKKKIHRTLWGAYNHRWWFLVCWLSENWSLGERTVCCLAVTSDLLYHRRSSFIHGFETSFGMPKSCHYRQLYHPNLECILGISPNKYSNFMPLKCDLSLGFISCCILCQMIFSKKVEIVKYHRKSARLCLSLQPLFLVCLS